MPSKDYIVKIVASERDADWALTLENVESVLVGAIGYSGDIAIYSVTEFNQADYTLTRTGKIQAIKEVRNLIQCTLLEAKMIVDIAATRGCPTSAFGVTVDYDASFEPNAYHVKRTA